MRKAMKGIAALLLASLQSGMAETIVTAQDYAVDSDVVLESAVREVKSIPKDTVNVVGDAVKFVVDEAETAVNGVKAVFKSNPVEKQETAALKEIGNAWVSANDIIFRSYKVSESVGGELTAGKETSAGSAVDVSAFFAGIEFPKGTSALYRPEFKRLFVRQTLENVLAIEDALAEHNKAKRDLMGKQVEIQTKFVEVNQSTLNELGFNWDLSNVKLNKTTEMYETADKKLFGDLLLPATDLLTGGLRTSAGALVSGVAADTVSLVKQADYFPGIHGYNKFVHKDWSLAIKALEQDDNTDVLSAPRITTRDGKSANIWVGEQRMVPKAFKDKFDSSCVFIEHSDWKSELVGVQLEVTPKLLKGGLIGLDLKPRVMDLVGYDTYNIVPSNSKMEEMTFGNNGQGETGFVIPAVNAKLPYFRLREMTTSLTVADGNTVGLGGLIYDKVETYKDKVPVLGSIPLIGRLFRSEGENIVKRNLMVFVTATEVDANGRRAADLAMKK